MGRRGGDRRLAAALFTDIVGSTEIASELGNARWRVLVTRHHAIMRANLKRFGGHERDTAGDGFFATFQVPADAVRCAAATQVQVRALGIEIRAGVSFGQVEVVDGKPGGLVVVSAARIMGNAGAGEVLVSASVKDVMPGAGIALADRGPHRLKGLEDEMHLYAVTAIDGEPVEPPESDSEVARQRRDASSPLETAGSRRSALVVGGLVGIAVIVAIVVVMASRDPEAAPPPAASGPPANSLVGLDPGTGDVTQVIPIELSGRTHSPYNAGTSRGVAGKGGVWLVRDAVVLHVDPDHDEVGDPPITHGSWGVAGFPISITIGDDRLWAALATLYTVDPTTDKVAPFARPKVDTTQTFFWFNTIAVGGGWVWLPDSNGTLWRISVDDPKEIRTLEGDGTQTDGVAADGESVWTFDSFAGTVTRVDPRSMKPAEPQVITSGVDGIALLDGDLWVLSRSSGTLFQLGSSVVAQVGPEPSAIAAGLDALWVGDVSGKVYRVDPVTSQSTLFYRAGGAITSLMPDENRGVLWVDVGSPDS